MCQITRHPPTSQPFRRCRREALLRDLMARDAAIVSNRTKGLDSLVAREPVRRTNPTYDAPPRPSETIFDGSYRVLRP